MKNVLFLSQHRRQRDDIEIKATEWLLLFEKRKPTKAQFIEFMAWYHEDPAHQQRFSELAQTWDSLVNLPISVADSHENKERHYLKKLAAAACVALAIGSLWLTTPAVSVEQHASFATVNAQRSTELLSDGSEIRLDSNTQLNIDFSAEKRDLKLNQGQAYFAVSHDKSRPFIVDTQFGSVRAVGTAFNVDIAENTLSVLVTEGTVAISSPNQKASALVDAGHLAVLVDDEFVVTQKNSLQQENSLAWQSGKLVFHGQTLAEVSRAISRYHPYDIIFENEAISAIQVGGTFSADNIEGLLESLESAFNVKHRFDSNDRLILFNG